MEQEYKYMVCTSCMTYNHAPYILDAMNGFTIQETTYPVVTLIVDDASTDGEPEVIRQYLADNFREPYRIEETEYADIICAQHKTNPNCEFVVFLLKYNHHSIKKRKMTYLSEWLDNAKYHALCEGDDYWKDPQKILKQVDYLENHNEVNICVHNADKYICSTRSSVPFNASLPTRKYSIKEVIRMKWFTPTASFLHRNNITISPLWSKNGCNGDMALLYSNLLKGDLFYDADVMSVYRYGTPSSLTTASDVKVLYQKKMNMYRTLNMLTEHKYTINIWREILKLKLYNWSIFKKVNSIRIRMRFHNTH